VIGAVVLAALSLLRPWALAFDPMAWLVWGRQVWHLSLDTTTGPSWKPLPVVLTTVFTLFGGVAPALWLIVARAGGLLALAGAFVLGSRLAGRWAGAGAAATMALSPWWAYNTALGNSEGLLAAAALWAAIAHLAGRPRAALALLTVASLLRPEAWPFLGVYGLWLWRARPADRVAVVVAGALVPLLWFGPDVIGAGGALGASKSARGTPSPGSAGLADNPAVALLGDFVRLASLPAIVAAGLAVLLAIRRPRDRAILALAAAAVGWVAIVVAMTAVGYAGNPRYLVAAAAIVAVLAGVGAVRVAAARGAPLGAAVLVLAVAAATAGTLSDNFDDLSARADASSTFAGVLAAAGGADALKRCGPIRTSTSARTFVASHLNLPIRDINARPQRPGVVIRARWFYGAGLEPPVDPAGYRVLASSRYWQVLATCGGLTP
jgi:hypothetical protein